MDRKLIIEEWLKNKFRLDQIIEIKKEKMKRLPKDKHKRKPGLVLYITKAKEQKAFKIHGLKNSNDIRDKGA